MAFGKPPFPGEDDAEQILKIMSLLGTPSIIDYGKLPKQINEMLW
jgi:serine/threonine protein kinase